MHLPKITRLLPLLSSLLLLNACGNPGNETGRTQGSYALSLLWELAPESTESEPWFGGYMDLATRGDRLYVTDPIRCQAFALSDAGEFLGYIGRKGAGPGEYQRTNHIAVSATGRIYLSFQVSGALLVYDADRQFKDRVNPPQSYRGSLILSNPVVLSDTRFAYELSSRKPFPAVEEAQDIPMVLVSDGSGILTLGTRRLTPSFENRRLQISEGWHDNLYYRLTGGELMRGRSEDELLHIPYSNPFAIQRLNVDGTEHWIHYGEEQPSGDWLLLFEDIPPDRYDSYVEALPKRIFIGPSPEYRTSNILSYRYQLLGSAVHESILYVLVGTLGRADGPPSLQEKELYVIDLEEGEVRYSLDVSDMQIQDLLGITDSQMLITSVRSPSPGLAAWSIIPSP